MSRFDAFTAQLEQLEQGGRLRRLAPRVGVDFASNDYLGLAQSSNLRDAAAMALNRGVPLGAGGSRLLRGNHPEHEALEAEAAAQFGAERALFFANGFIANMALFATLPQRGDIILYDELIHASAHDGMSRSRAAHVAVAHNDADAFADAIRLWRAQGHTGQIWIAVESLYSMDGDLAPLDALAVLADAHDAVLVIDEAHATGVYGAQGAGLAEALEGRDNVITLHTFGKALGCEGALVCGPSVLIDFLINRARGFIFTTAPSPLMAAVCRAALKLVSGNMERQFTLASLVAHAGQQLHAKLGITPTPTQIQPIIIGDDVRTMSIAAVCQKAGFDVRGIRPPTVPEGTSRLRLSLTLNATVADVDALVDVLSGALGDAR